MTHDEILQNANRYSNALLVDYISLAVADGWSRTATAETLNRYIEERTGTNCWSRITSLYDEYMKEYAPGFVEKPGNPTKGKKVVYNGQQYETITEASEKTGVPWNTLKRETENGVKEYIYNGKVYSTQKEIAESEGLQRHQVETLSRGKKLEVRYKKVGFYV